MEDKEIKIVKLDWNQAIRSRSGMYIGATNNPSVLLREAVDNSVDELYGSIHTSRIYISTSATDYNVVADNGRGIPITWDDANQMTSAQLACTSTHTGSKFEKEDVAVGMNGIGISATNALSSSFIILSKVTKNNFDKSIPEVKDTWLNGKGDKNELFYVVEFSEGNKVSEGCLFKTEIEDEAYPGLKFPTGMSTITAFKPDPTIFEELNCSIPTKNLTYVLAIMQKIYNRSVSIEVNGKLLQNEFKPYQFEFIKEVKGMDWGGKQRKATFYVNFECDKNLSVADFSGSVNSLVVDRGLHLEAVKQAYTESLRNYFGLAYNNVLSGLRMNVVSIATEVDFSSQTKERCTKIEGLLTSEISKGLTNEFRKIFKANEDYFSDHIQRLNEYIASLTKISTINKVKNAIGTLSGGGTRVRSKVPKAVRDASINNRMDAELFIVEGKSASGTIINTRDPRTQAVLELRGVPMNSVNKDLDEILDNEEMNALISAIGIGVNEYYDEKLARYGKIIIAADADSDGFRIASLILGMIAKKMTFLIRKGMVFVLRSPLYIQDGKFIYQEDLSLLNRDKPYTRIKGLGELNEDQGAAIITNPNTRRLLQITMDNVEDALSLLTSTSARKQLMIDSEVVTDPYNLGFWY